MANHILMNNSNLLQGLMGKLTVLAEFNALFTRYVDPELSKHCQVVKFEKNCLFVIADNGSWGTQLRFQIPDLMANLRKHPGLEKLAGIICKTRPTQVFAKPPKPFRKIAKLSPETAENILETAKSIQDPKLRQTLERIAQHLKSS